MHVKIIKGGEFVSFKVISRKKMILNCIYRSVFNVLALCGKEACSATVMENNVRLFTFARSELESVMKVLLEPSRGSQRINLIIAVSMFPVITETCGL